MESIMQLDNWCIMADDVFCISGDVSKNPRFEGGDFVTTSPLIAVDPEAGVIKTRSGSLYKLGEPKADYEEAFPNAKVRLFAACSNKFQVNG